MRKSKASLISVLAITCAVVCFFAAFAATEKTLVIPRPIRQLGELREGQVVEEQFEILNNLGEPISVCWVDQPCSCIAANIDEHNLKPGQRTRLVTRWQVGRQKGPVAWEVVKVKSHNLEPLVVPTMTQT